MDVSYLKEHQKTTITREPNTCKWANLITALGIITLIGSLVATASLYSSLGPSSTGIVAGGAALFLLTLYTRKHCRGTFNCGTTVRTVTKPQHPTQTTTLKQVPNTQKFQTQDYQINNNLQKTLPFILSLDLTSNLQSSSILLERGISPKNFIDPKYKILPESPNVQIFLDTTLLNIPLQFWINHEPSHFNKCLETIKDPLRSQQVEIINERIEQLDSAIQLKERLKRLDFSSDLTVEHLLPAWKLATDLKLMLAMDDELSQITVSSICSLNPVRVWTAIGRRCASLGKERKNDLSDLPIKDIPLIDLPRVTADPINNFPQDFPGFICLMISPEELAKIDTSKLTNEQMESLFTPGYYDGSKFVFEYRIKKLLPHQIDASISRFPKSNFAFLTDDQVVGLDHTKIDQNIFDNLFGKNINNRISRLTTSSVNTLFTFFSKQHWKHLSDEQIQNFDFSQVKESERKKVFNLIFCEIKTNFTDSEFLSLLPENQLQIVKPYLPLVN